MQIAPAGVRCLEPQAVELPHVCAAIADKRTALGPSAPPTSRPSRSRRQAPRPPPRTAPPQQARAARSQSPSLVSLARSRAGPGRRRAPPAVSSGRHGPGGSQLAPPPRPIFAPASVFVAMLGGLQGQALVDAPLSVLNGQEAGGPSRLWILRHPAGPFPLGGDPRGSANRACRYGLPRRAPGRGP